MKIKTIYMCNITSGERWRIVLCWVCDRPAQPLLTFSNVMIKGIYREKPNRSQFAPPALKEYFSTSFFVKAFHI